MNRHQRRAAKKGFTVYVDYGELLESDPNYGLPVNCYACGTPHKALGIARINGQSNLFVPVCISCLASDDDAIIRKYLNSPELTITECSEEQINAMTNKQDKTEH